MDSNVFLILGSLVLANAMGVGGKLVYDGIKVKKNGNPGNPSNDIKDIKVNIGKLETNMGNLTGWMEKIDNRLGKIEEVHLK